jgi:hypothetical protein
MITAIHALHRVGGRVAIPVIVLFALGVIANASARVHEVCAIKV